MSPVSTRVSSHGCVVLSCLRIHPLMPRSWVQAWIEASTKGAVLLFTASEIESATTAMGVNPAAAGLIGGMGGGIAQAYATMGACAWFGVHKPSTHAVHDRFLHMYEDGRDHPA